MGIKKRGKTEDKVENKAENFKTTTNKNEKKT